MKRLHLFAITALALGMSVPNFLLAAVDPAATAVSDKTIASEYSSPYLFALQGQADTEGPVNFDLYASFNRVISSNYRSGSGLEKAVMTFYAKGVASQSCSYDLKTNSQDCTSQYLTVVSPLANKQAVVKLNFASSTSALEKVVFDLYYATSTDPSGYTFTVGDSRSNDGWGGDAGTQSNDAEMQIYNTTLDAYGNDQSSLDGVNRNVVHLSDSIHQGAHVTVTVKNSYLGWSIINPVISGGSTFTYHLQNKWQFLGSVTKEMNGQAILDVFPNVEGTVYKYDGGYKAATTFVTGEGYWLKNKTNESVAVSGTEIDSVSYNLNGEGQYLIGAPFTMNLQGIACITDVQHYNDQTGGYDSNWTIERGAAAFVKTNGSCAFTKHKSDGTASVVISAPVVSNLSTNSVRIDYTVSGRNAGNPSLCYSTVDSVSADQCIGLVVNIKPDGSFTTGGMLTGLKPASTYYYQLILDKGTGFELRDKTYSFTTLKTATSDLPDLIIDRVTLLPTMTATSPANTVSFNVTLKNIGVATVTSTFYVSAEVPPYTSKSSQHQQSQAVTAVLAPQATYEVAMGPLQSPPGQQTKYPARVYADFDVLNHLNTNLVKESREDNNLYEFDFCRDGNGQFDCKKDVPVTTDDEADDDTPATAEEVQSGDIKVLRDKVKEQAVEIKYLRQLNQQLQQVNDAMKERLNQFIAYGVDANTQKLGEGERAAVIYSFQQAYGQLPQTEAELSDAIKIANGLWPSVKNQAAERKAATTFKEIYQREPNMNNPNDNAAVVIMAYGLRQRAENRNLKSEAQGLGIFNDLFDKTPGSTEEWNTLQAITYSGASRQVVDSDNDGLSDKMEQKLGTDPKNPDTDGDGYLDGQEVAHGYSPLK